ncbi:hypothetical protein [Aquabacterium sp.]|jgi:ABC-type phosphate transport system substrate-binding protein|uniref:hypothetical protein n=1 Tax=Aquabacterium sp. TaxID=1872578 RepID=UPI00403811CA
MNIKHAIQAAAAVALLALVQTASAQVAVIVNPKSSIASITPEQAAAIFLGKSSMLPSGQTAVPADLPESSQAREIFYSKAAGKSPAQVKATWARLTFSGKATPPKELPTAADVKKLVVANPDAIGYIEKSAADSTVKVVLTLE